MQTYLEALKSALRSLRANKLRSVLTTLGVVIGTFSVIGLVSIVSGLEAEIKSEIVGLGAETLDIIPTDTSKGGGIMAGGMMSSFSETYQLAGNFSRGKREERSFLIGVTPEYFKIRNKGTAAGRLFSETDSAKRAKVLVIGEGLATELFGTRALFGKTIKANGVPFEVIGVLEKESMKMGNIDLNKTSYIPARTTQQVFPEAKVNEIIAKVKPSETVAGAAREIERILEDERGDEGFSVLTQKDMMDLIDRITGIISLALAGVASISLLVGGIGIMNIMLVSVTERTKEIGLRKALGAEDKDILAQFLIEAMVLCLLGGIIGVVVAEAGSLLVTRYTDLPSMVDPTTVGVALLFSITIGLIFGTAPAIKAAKLDPIEALRHE